MSKGRHAGRFAIKRTNQKLKDRVGDSALNIAITLLIYGATTVVTGLVVWLAVALKPAVWASHDHDPYGVVPNLLGGLAWLAGVGSIVAWAYAVAYLLGFAFARARIYPQARSGVISGYYYLFAFIIAFGPVCAMAELFRGESIYFSMAVAAFIVMVPVGYGAQNGLLRVHRTGRGDGGADIAGDPAEGVPGRQLSQGGSVSARPES